MKIALICPSNMLYMPYVRNYKKILIEQHIDYDIINWDRFQMEEIREHTYRDKKKGHQRNYIEYLKYKNFLLNKLNSIHYDKIIVFGIQLCYFLNKILMKLYKGNYIIDIRDYNKILNFFNLKQLIENSAFTVLSSPGYTEWLPKSNKYVINHNTQASSINELKEIEEPFNNKEKIKIANIGAIRDFKINKKFVNILKNHEKFILSYIGEGDINKKFLSYLNKNHINNVFMSGRYKKEDEEYLYNQSDFINVLRYNDGINNKTALPNRLYNAVFAGKPLLALKGTYLSNEISNYNLGLVLTSIKNDKENTLLKYLNEFDVAAYQKGREAFFKKVIQENNHFNKKINEFIS